MKPVSHILLIRLKSIGDVLFTLPAVNLVRDNFPDARIAFLTSKENAPLVSGFAAVDELVTLDRSAFRRINPVGIWNQTLGLWRRLHRTPSLAVDFQGYGETALLTWLTRAPQRWSSLRRRSRWWAYTHWTPRDNGLQPVENHLSLLLACGLKHAPVRNEFHLRQSEVQRACELFTQWGLNPARPSLFIQPFTSAPHKDWPLEKFLLLAERARADGLQVLFGGAPAERAALEPVHHAGFPVAAGVPLLTAAGLMKLSTLVVGGDTGLLHLAVALGKRVVMVMQPGRTFPFGHPDWIVTPPTGQPVANIQLDAVAAACADAFKEIRRAEFRQVSLAKSA